MICQIDNITFEVPSILSQILKIASKLNYSACLRNAGDLRVYSQLPLPIC